MYACCLPVSLFEYSCGSPWSSYQKYMPASVSIYETVNSSTNFDVSLSLEYLYIIKISTIPTNPTAFSIEAYPYIGRITLKTKKFCYSQKNSFSQDYTFVLCCIYMNLICSGPMILISVDCSMGFLKQQQQQIDNHLHYSLSLMGVVYKNTYKLIILNFS